MPLDLFLLITQGQFSKNKIIGYPDGYYIIEEEIISPGGGGGGATIWGAPQPQTSPKKQKLQKRIKIKFFLSDKKEFEKEIIVKDINLKVKEVEFIEKNKVIKVRLINGENEVEKKIKI